MKTRQGRSRKSAEKTQPPAFEWTREHAQALRAALGPRAGEADAPFRYCELAGFLFALACAPELVKASEWLPLVLGEDPEAFGSEEQAQRLLDLVMRLYNHVNLQVLERTPSLPAGVDVRPEPMDNFAPDAPLSQWARGFSHGHAWLEKTWDACLEAEPKAEADVEVLDETLGAIMVVLGFFASRAFAEGCVAEMKRRRTVEALAPKMLANIPEAMRELAQIGRGLYEIQLERGTPARGAKSRLPRDR